jgi:hypothetical protein
MKRIAVAIAFAVLVATVQVTPTSAGLVLSLDDPNSALSPYTGPYGTVTVTRVSNTMADIVFTGSTNGIYTYLFGGVDAIALNVNGSVDSWSVSDVVQPAGHSAPSFTSTGAGTVDGRGDFNFTLKEFDGFGYAYSSVTLHITDTGASWASDADVLTATGNGMDNLVAAHIFVTLDGGDTNGPATGFAADGDGDGGGGQGPGDVPEAATLVMWSLLGTLTLGVCRLRRRYQAT